MRRFSFPLDAREADTVPDVRAGEKLVFWLTVSSLPPVFPRTGCGVTSWEVVTDYSGATASDFHGLPFAFHAI